jgi:membrane associated rhomboid family serine protease
MPRARKPVAVLCIAIVIFAAVVPSAAIQLHIFFTPLWLVVPAIIVVLLRRTAQVCHEQPSSLLSIGSSRAPPAALVIA